MEQSTCGTTTEREIIMSSKRHQRKKECENKRQYVKEHIQKSLIVLQRLQNDYNLHSYKCKFCGKYHIGHFNPNAQNWD